ncbi:hypothetical protein BBF96_10140 [Anoxybacter fermentans]|uniref:ABC transporter ATP-binding protein n=1 Tax=Anoxybacter fermentans TaxID=1323375 RepID=A0A3Q9HRI8_9FIRM|nr:ABC transporter ATP-binding protein [Anoxybacter fermentans]AZR73711.1 hypothetical protein BBF96_10140 [Anoxybacter fermentans]
MKKKEGAFYNFMRIVKIFPQSWLLYITIIVVIILSGITIFYSYLMKGLIDAALSKNLSVFFRFLYWVIGSIICELILTYLKIKLSGKYAELGVARLRKLIAEHLSLLPLSKLENNHSGDYISRLTNDVNRIQTFASETIIEIIYRPLAALGAFCYLTFLSWKLTLLTTLLVPILFLGAVILSNPMTKYSKQLQERLGVVNSIVQETIFGIEISKAFNLKERLERKYNSAVDNTVKSAKALAKRNALLNSFSHLISLVPFLICFCIGGYWVVRGEMTPGSLIAFINLLNHLTFPISVLPTLLGQVKTDMVAAGRLFEILDIKVEREGGQVFRADGKDVVVQFNNVSFAYEGQGEKVLNNLSFKINRGEVVALVGPSGSGKSTIVKLLLGYYEDFTGEIKVFEESLHEWNLTALREQISFVSQDTYLFPESIRENINYGKLKATFEEIVSAAKVANAHEFIMNLRDGYDTKVGELGGKLSGGQKQRISIARAVLKNAPLLLLDEPTSALDTDSEALVQEALDRFMKERTVLIIAHRLSTIKNADRILVIDQGRIVEEGTHDQLLKKGGLYSQLYYRQMANEEIIERKEVM